MRKTYDGKIYQEVHIIDADGEAWEALYTLESQGDGSVKIGGCVLKKAVTSLAEPPLARGTGGTRCARAHAVGQRPHQIGN